jgi:hypothetical protein
MIEILDGKKTKKAIVTLAIGEKYLKKWEQNSLPSLLKYCKNHSLGLYVQTNPIDTNEPRKKPQWQKILLPAKLKESFPYIDEYCYLDTDIVANQFAKSIFDLNIADKLSLVSQFSNLPYDLNEILRRIAFYRNKFYSKTYPLDSSLFMGFEEIYKYQNLPTQEDYACTGVFMGFVEAHAEILTDIYSKYDHTISTLTDGGDEPILNFEFQNKFNINWIPYHYQSIWIYEMAYKYPFLYKDKVNTELINKCIENSIYSNTFLHFAGSWDESKMFENIKGINFDSDLQLEFEKYKKIKVTGKPVGVTKPKNEF